MRITFITAAWFLDTVVPLINTLIDEVDVDLIVNVYSKKKEWMPSGYLNLLKKYNKNLRVHIIFWQSLKTLSFRNWLKFFRLKKIVNGDVIHLQFYTAQYYFLLRFFSKTSQRLVFDIHDVETHTGESRSYCGKAITKKFIQRADEIIIHSFYSGRVFEQLYNISSKKNVIPFGAIHLVENNAKLRMPEESSTILFFGRVSPYKGIEYLIKAAPAIKREIPNLKVILAGKGDYYFDISRFNNDSSSEVINRYIANRELAELIQRAAVVVCPYTDATQSGVVMTAYAFNKPVVATKVGAMPEIIENNVTGLLVPPRDSQKLAEAIVDLLKNPGKRKKMSENINKKLSQRNFSWNFIAGKTIAVYQKAVEVQGKGKTRSKVNVYC